MQKPLTTASSKSWSVDLLYRKKLKALYSTKLLHLSPWLSSLLWRRNLVCPTAPVATSVHQSWLLNDTLMLEVPNLLLDLKEIYLGSRLCRVSVCFALTEPALVVAWSELAQFCNKNVVSL